MEHALKWRDKCLEPSFLAPKLQNARPMKERALVTHLNAGRGQLATGATPSLRHALIITYSSKNTISLQELMIKQAHHSVVE